MQTDAVTGHLLQHDRWANLKVVDACARFAPDAYHEDRGVGLGGLHRQLAHIAIVIRCWTDVLDGKEMREDPDDFPWTIERMRTELIAAHDGFDRAATERPLTETMPREYSGRAVHLERGAIVAHVTTHNMHHRAQCLHLLKLAGMEEPLRVSLVSWRMQRLG